MVGKDRRENNDDEVGVAGRDIGWLTPMGMASVATLLMCEKRRRKCVMWVCRNHGDGLTGCGLLVIKMDAMDVQVIVGMAIMKNIKRRFGDVTY